MSPTTNIEYTVTRTDDELQQILDLQTANRAENISPEELASQGFVTARHTLQVLKAMHQEYPHVIAKHGDKVIGYALCMMQSAEQIVPSLAGLFAAIESVPYQEKTLINEPLNGSTSNAFRYFVMGQVCLDKDYRGCGAFQGLYQHMRTVMSLKFQGIATSISTRNPRSLRAHAKVGFQVIHEYTAKGEDWKIVLWDWTKNNDMLPPSATPSPAMVSYHRTQSDEDLAEILSLQRLYLKGNVSKDEREKEGFLSLEHDLETLRQMHEDFPHAVAKATSLKATDSSSTGKIVGYALSMLPAHHTMIPIIKGSCEQIESCMFRGKSLKEDWKYCLVGQVCVAKEYRGQGVFAGVYHQLKEIMSPHFDCIVTAIAATNPRSLRAHAKVGFETLCEYTDGEDWKMVIWDWSPPAADSAKN